MIVIMIADLVFDVGSNNGDDAAHYLRRGFRVVAIEAAAEWASHLRTRFASELVSGKLVLIECAIARHDGTVTFHVSESNRGVWSSLDLSRAAREGVKSREMTIAARTLTSVMQDVGVPYFMKVDIEGADRICLEAIDPRDPPHFVSFEATESEVADLYGLHAKGYRRFRLVDQTTFASVPPPRLHSGALMRSSVLHLARQAKKRRTTAPPPPRAPRMPGFEVSSSGPMPHEHPGAWATVDDVALAWLYYVKNSGIGRWFDVHAAR